MAETSRDSVPPPAHNPRAISLRLVLLFVTCCAVVLGLIWHWPGVVPLLGGLAIVAVARTWSMLKASDTSALRSTGKPWALSLLGSLAVLTLVGSTSAAAFFAVCFPLGATQHPVSEVPPVPLLYDAAWLLAGAAAGVIATLSLDLLWLRPLSERTGNGEFPTTKQRMRRYFAVAMPPLAAIVVGGLFSLFPAAFFHLSGTWSVPACVAAAFIACLVTFVIGGWVGLRVTQNSAAAMAAVLAILVGMLPTVAILMTLKSTAFLINPSRPIPLAGTWDGLLVVGGGIAIMVTMMAVWRWSRQPD